MRGRKPKLDNVVPLKGDGEIAGDVRREAIARVVDKLRPRGLTHELSREWTRVATMLAEPTVDRLKARFVDVILEFCRVTVRLRKFRAMFAKLEDEAFETTGRHGTQWKSHPQIAQMNEAWRQWRSLVAMLGLSPADERNLLPGQGDLFDEADKHFA